MRTNSKLKKRDLYLNKLIAFKDTEPIKVVTGIRRCGKSSLLKLMQEYLLDNGVSQDQIIKINFESYEFKDMTTDDFYNYVKSRIIEDKKMYLFFDEVQRMAKWEECINAFRVDFNSDIYITGSNAYLLSSEYSTYLSGRCIEIKMLPLSFSEFLSFHNFKVIEEKNSLGVLKKNVYDKSGERLDIKEVFDAYLRYGGMPGIDDVGLEQEKVMTLLEGIYSTVIVRDILEREKRKGEHKVTDSILLRKITLYLADNIGSNISPSNIGNVLVNEGLLEERKKSGTPGVHTIQSYISTLMESYFFYDIKRFDIKGKELLRTLGKYYIVDIGLRNYLLGMRNRDTGHVLENIVYLELIRRGYDVAIGKIGNLEVDFVATNSNEKVYIQVTESLINENVKEREITPLEKIHDHYEKIILTLDTGFDNNYNGIKLVNVIDWLLKND